MMLGASRNFSATHRIIELRPDQSVVAIDRLRADKGMSHEEMCRRARVSLCNWHAMRRGDFVPRDSTIERLRAVLTAANSDPVPLNVIAAFYRATVVLLALEAGADPTVVFAQDLSVSRPVNKIWLQAARLHNMAMYIATVELEVSNAVLARAIDGTRQNVKRARSAVEDMRDGDPAIEALLTVVTSRLRGK